MTEMKSNFWRWNASIFIQSQLTNACNLIWLGFCVTEQIWNPCISWNAKAIEGINQNCMRSASRSGKWQIKASIPVNSSSSLSLWQQVSVNVSSLITVSRYSSQISHGKRINALIMLTASPVYMCLAQTNAFLIELNCSIRLENNWRSPRWHYS